MAVFLVRESLVLLILYVCFFIKKTNTAELDGGYAATVATDKHLFYIDAQFVPRRKYFYLHYRKTLLVLFKEIIIEGNIYEIDLIHTTRRIFNGYSG
jgi:hypothetical protein